MTNHENLALIWLQHNGFKGTKKQINQQVKTMTFEQLETVLLDRNLIHSKQPLFKLPIYMAEFKSGSSWDEQEQTLLDTKSWQLAIDIAKSSVYNTRLSHSKGYNNQGYYFCANSTDY